jgi:hypothetical protein
MAIIDFTNFERQGNIEGDIRLESAEEITQAALEQTANTLQTVKIFSHDLEKDIYNNDAFRSALLKLSQGNRHAAVQILVNDISTALHEGHKLIGLAQQISSIVTIKDTPIDYQGLNVSFILFDKDRFIFKPDRSINMAIQSNCRSRANKLADFFNSAWEYAEQNPQTRRLSI